MEANAILDDFYFQDALKPYVIQVVAPASGVHTEKINQLQALESLNIDLSLSTLQEEISYHSNSDELRFQQLKKAVLDESPNTLIWALRGGYGSARLIERLNDLPKPPQEKTFIGFSDNTALHLFFSKQWHWSCIHGSGFSQILDPNQDPQNFIKIADILTKKGSGASIDLIPFNDKAFRSTPIQGLLTGGNLTLVENSIGTLWQIQTQDKILFLEEIGEKGYRIDRSLLHLHQAGLLNQVKAIVLGEFLHALQDSDIAVALQRFAKDVPIPVYKSNQFGHGKLNYPLIYNSMAQIQTSAKWNEWKLHMPI